MFEVVELANARIELDERPGCLLLTVHGNVLSMEELGSYTAAIERIAERTGQRRALIDSRRSDHGARPAEVRDAMWQWLISGRVFDQIAFVLDNEIQVAGLNMTALSSRASIRAFGTVQEAHRWLSGRQRTMSTTLATPVPPAPGTDPRASQVRPSGQPPRRPSVLPPSPSPTSRETQRIPTPLPRSSVPPRRRDDE